MRQRGLKWWTLCVVHNVVVHPWLPVAEVIEVLGFKKAAEVVYWLHDKTVPEGGG